MAKRSRKYVPRLSIPKGRATIRRHLGLQKCGHTLLAVRGTLPRASDANNRILRRSVDGATTADMAFIAQEAAMTTSETGQSSVA